VFYIKERRKNMFYVYTKNKKSQVVFTVNLSADEVKNFTLQ